MVGGRVRRHGWDVVFDALSGASFFPLAEAPGRGDHPIGFMSLFSLLNPAKDFALGAAVKLWFNQTLKRYGTMTHIQIDSKTKHVEVDLDLRGETTPLHVVIESYQLHSSAGETFIDIGGVHTSREWINCLIEDLLQPGSRRFKVPAALKMVL